MKFAIRDDDISFFTRPEDLENIYKEIWERNILVSFSVVPFSVESHYCGDWDNFYQETELKAIGENKDLVDFLKSKLKENKISIMLHGYSHQYKVAENKNGVLVLATKENLENLRKYKKGSNLYWVGEYRWKPYEQLRIETKEGKEYLEDLFSTKITVFVPPSNDISKEGVKAVSENGLNISGTMLLSKFNRPITIYSIKNWFLKLWWRLKYNKVYPYVMDYKTHKELCAYGLVPNINFEDLRQQFEFCNKLNAPFVLSIHYWEILKKLDLQNIFYQFLKFVQNYSGKFCFVEDCYD